MTEYKDLTEEEQLALKQNIISDLPSVADLEFMQRIRAGEICCVCLMVWYNCLCSHED